MAKKPDPKPTDPPELQEPGADDTDRTLATVNGDPLHPVEAIAGEEPKHGDDPRDVRRLYGF